MNQVTQRDAIKSHLLSGGTLTGLQALDMFGCFRLPSRICELKKEGMNISRVMISVNGTAIAKYFLA